MNKKVLLQVLFIFFCFFIVENVSADTCTTTELNTLKQLAYNINFSYELHDDTYNENHTYYFDILATNFSDQFYMVDMDGQQFNYMEGLEEEGLRNLRVVNEGIRYRIEIYASNATNCSGTQIMTKEINLPYYNDYSQREECVGIEDFDLCQPYYDGYIESEEYFLEQVEKYKNGEIALDTEKEEEGIFDQIINFVSSNLLIVIPVLIVLVLIIVIIIIRVIKARKRTRIKI